MSDKHNSEEWKLIPVGDPIPGDNVRLGDLAANHYYLKDGQVFRAEPDGHGDPEDIVRRCSFKSAWFNTVTGEVDPPGERQARFVERKLQ